LGEIISTRHCSRLHHTYTYTKQKIQAVQASMTARKLENHETKMAQVKNTPDKEVLASLT